MTFCVSPGPRNMLAAAAALALLALPSIASAELRVDPAHTSASFSVKHLTLTTIHGTIAVKDVNLAAGADDTLTSAQATFELASIDTKVPDRDNDLRSEHWFEIAKYPTMTFKSTKIEGDKNAMNISGDLTFHGVTKPVTLAAKFVGSVKDGKGHTHVGYSATTTFDRLAWNLGPNYPPVIVGNDVTVTIELEAVLT